MSATGPDGVEWVRAAEALERIPGLRYRTLQSWWARGEVRCQRVGRQVWVVWDDVLTHEAAAALVAKANKESRVLAWLRPQVHSSANQEPYRMIGVICVGAGLAAVPAMSLLGHRRLAILWLAALVLVLALVAAAAVGIVRTLLHKSIPAKQAAAGQCIQDPEKHDEPVVTDCDSDDAAYRVSAPAGSTCTQVPGTTTVYETMCLIDTKKAPATVLSSAKVGDCLDIDATGEQATISECTSGTHPILMILNDVGEFDTKSSTFVQDACQKAGVDAGAYDSMYAWAFGRFLSSIEASTNVVRTYDYAFCLGHPNP